MWICAPIPRCTRGRRVRLFRRQSKSALSAHRSAANQTASRFSSPPDRRRAEVRRARRQAPDTGTQRAPPMVEGRVPPATTATGECRPLARAVFGSDHGRDVTVARLHQCFGARDTSETRAVARRRTHGVTGPGRRRRPKRQTAMKNVQLATPSTSKRSSSPRLLSHCAVQVADGERDRFEGPRGCGQSRSVKARELFDKSYYPVCFALIQELFAWYDLDVQYRSRFSGARLWLARRARSSPRDEDFEGG